MSSNDSLGDRLKSYENTTRTYLPNRMPVICRIDGKNWHRYTSDCQRPFDAKLIDALNETGMYMCKNIQGCKIAYLQSDEITFLLYNYDFKSDGWFQHNIQKMVSVSASMASAYFTSISHKVFGETKLAMFDARVFTVPLDEVCNVMEWRQQDCTRNSVQMLARSLASHKECNNKNNSELQELCFQRGSNWNDLPTHQRRGRCITKHKIMKEETIRNVWTIDNEIPIFHLDRNYIDQYLIPPPKDTKDNE